MLSFPATFLVCSYMMTSHATFISGLVIKPFELKKTCIERSLPHLKKLLLGKVVSVLRVISVKSWSQWSFKDSFCCHALLMTSPFSTYFFTFFSSYEVIHQNLHPSAPAPAPSVKYPLSTHLWPSSQTVWTPRLWTNLWIVPLNISTISFVCLFCLFWSVLQTWTFYPSCYKGAHCEPFVSSELYLHIRSVMKLLDQVQGVAKVDADGVNGIFLCQSHRHQVRTQRLMFALDSAELLQNSCKTFLKMQPHIQLFISRWRCIMWNKARICHYNTSPFFKMVK